MDTTYRAQSPARPPREWNRELGPPRERDARDEIERLRRKGKLSDLTKASMLDRPMSADGLKVNVQSHHERHRLYQLHFGGLFPLREQPMTAAQIEPAFRLANDRTKPRFEHVLRVLQTRGDLMLKKAGELIELRSEIHSNSGVGSFDTLTSLRPLH